MACDWGSGFDAETAKKIMESCQKSRTGRDKSKECAAEAHEHSYSADGITKMSDADAAAEQHADMCARMIAWKNPCTA